MSLSTAFIKRPIGTTLLAIALALIGVAAWPLLPARAAAPGGFPHRAGLGPPAGASPETMASNVAQPLERQFSLIAGSRR